MDDYTKKMLVAIANGQSAMRGEFMEKFDQLEEKIDKVEKNLTNRIDNLGRHIAEVDDDAPSGEDFADLEKRVTKLEHQIAAA